jgi:hypothetical protein
VVTIEHSVVRGIGLGINSPFVLDFDRSARQLSLSVTVCWSVAPVEGPWRVREGKGGLTVLHPIGVAALANINVTSAIT